MPYYTSLVCILAANVRIAATASDSVTSTGISTANITDWICDTPFSNANASGQYSLVEAPSTGQSHVGNYSWAVTVAANSSTDPESTEGTQTSFWFDPRGQNFRYFSTADLSGMMLTGRQ